jgi:tRNA threonylcarbamoyladenosine biosynthesis protein TsaB
VIILAVHSSSPQLGIAVVRDGDILVEEVLPSSREHLENIALAVRRTIAKPDMRLNAFDGFGVVVGPGSFSGIRVGMSFVKGLALALKKPVAGISSLEIVARQALGDGECGAAIIDARRGQVYACVYRRLHGRLIGLDEPRLILADEFPLYAQRFSEPLVLCGEPVIESIDGSCAIGARIVMPPPAPGVCAQIAWERIRKGNADNLHSLSPLYIRRSDAEEKRSYA